MNRLNLFLQIALFLQAAILFGVGALPAAAQQPPTPRLILNTQGPAGQIRSLAFSRNSQRLYAAGMDKVVHVWDVGWNTRLGNDQPDRVTYVRALRWEIARGNLGSIFALAQSPSRDEIAVAGVGARVQIGDIALFDTQQDKVRASLPSPQERQRDQRASGHLEGVVSLDYAPSGQRLLSASETGQVFLWDRRADDTWNSRELVPPGQRRILPPPAAFTSEQTIVFGEPTVDGNYRLRRRNLASGREITYPEIYPSRIAAVARAPERTPDGFWAVADGVGRVNLTRIADENERWQLRATYPHITDLAFGPNHLLAIASNETIDDRPGRGMVELWDVQARRRLDQQVVSSREKVLSVAISPNGQFLASHNEDQKEVVVFRLTTPAGGPLEKPLSSRPPARAAGQGRQVHKVAISSDDTKIAFGFAENSLSAQLDRGSATLESYDPQLSWKQGEKKLGAWSIEKVPGSLTRVRISENGVELAVIDLDADFQGTFRCGCFISEAETALHPTAIAIGTDAINGIFIYSIPVNGQPPRLLRWFRDHIGSVTSLVSASDGSILVSGAADQTMKVWSLRGIHTADPGFQAASIWGATFKVQAGRLVVADVVEAGIAHARGFRNGDQVTRVQGRLPDASGAIIGASADEQTPQMIFETLRNVSVFRQILINATDGRDQKAFIISPGWEPLLTSYMDHRGEWAIWHPTGYFNASPAEGGELFGWQINQGQDEPPLILKGDFFQKKFERPEVLSNLLALRGIEAALGDVGVDSPRSVSSVVSEIPEVTITSPTSTEALGAGEELQIAARLRFPDNERSRFEVRASIDGVRLGSPDSARQIGDEWYFTWRAEARGLMNQIEVLASEPGGALASYYGSDVVYRRGSEPVQTPYRLHILSLASEGYRGEVGSTRGGFGVLKFPIDDNEAVLQSLKAKAKSGTGHYSLGVVRQLQDDAITPDRLREEIKTINAAIGTTSATDLLIVYLSGHGTTIDGEYHYVTTSVESGEPAEIRRKGIPWSLLSQAGETNCRVVYMLDTCHSGSAVDVKSGIRDPRRSQAIVIAAASGKAEAFEHDELGHGCFTYAVLRGLDGDADGFEQEPDQQVDLAELTRFTTDLVRRLTLRQQRPTMSPQRLAETLQYPLVAVPKP